MRSILKTTLIAAVGAGILAAAPAFAKTTHHKHPAARAEATGFETANPYEPPMSLPTPNDPNWQTKLDYLKDPAIHRGN